MRKRAAGSALLGQLLGRACELLDEIDEALVARHPVRGQEVFARAAALHRDLEAIQSLMPPDRRPPEPRG